MEKVIIIGSGPAGYTAAIYTARANLAPVLFEGAEPGGQLTTTSEVENFPGFAKGVRGPEMMAIFKEQAERFGTRVVAKAVTAVDFSGRSDQATAAGATRGLVTRSRIFEVFCEGELYESRAVIIATGASAKRLGLPNEKKLYGKGVSACATCDGFFFKDKVVAVVGGGDTAMEEANFLTKFAKRVYVVHRRAEFRASPIMLERARNNPKIEFIMNTVVEDILGVDEGRVTGVRLKNVGQGLVPGRGGGPASPADGRPFGSVAPADSAGRQGPALPSFQDDKRVLLCDGVFAAIGHEPNTKLFAGQLELDQKGYIVTRQGSTMTSIEGVFAAGDCADYKYRQAVVAAGAGCMAAIDAERWLEE